MLPVTTRRVAFVTERSSADQTGRTGQIPTVPSHAATHRPPLHALPPRHNGAGLTAPAVAITAKRNRDDDGCPLSSRQAGELSRLHNPPIVPRGTTIPCKALAIPSSANGNERHCSTHTLYELLLLRLLHAAMRLDEAEPPAQQRQGGKGGVATAAVVFLRRYNEVKDVAQSIMSVIADRRGISLTELHQQRGLCDM